MRKSILFFSLAISLYTLANEQLSFEELSANWSAYKNKTVTITTPLVVSGSFYDSLILSTERLFCPEEHAVGLADGDSTMYYQIVADNQAKSICVHCRNAYYDVRTGDVIKGLTARVTSERHLVTGKTLRTKHTKQPKLVKKEKETLRIVGANIQNYFADLGGYATRRTTLEQQQMHTRKLVKALYKMDADIVALCEIQQGDKAPKMLLEELNKKGDTYAYVELGLSNKDRISSGFIYNTNRVQPYNEWISAYTDTANYYHPRMIAQGFEQLDKNGQSTGKRLIVSVNHFKSKRAGRQQYDTNQRRLANADSLLAMLPVAIDHFGDEDILLLGDYNCYTQEQPIQKIVRAGYADMLAIYCPNDYSYSFRGYVGFIDRCFANPSMQAQIVHVQPWHVNADWYYSHGAYKLRDKSHHRYSDHDPIIVDVKLK